MRMMYGKWTVRSKRGYTQSHAQMKTDNRFVIRFYKGVEDAYTFANRTLLKLLVDDQELLPRLR